MSKFCVSVRVCLCAHTRVLYTVLCTPPNRLTRAAWPGLLLQESGGALGEAWPETPETPVLRGRKRV